MNFKRLLATLAALFLFGTMAFGEIALKDLGNGQVEITFTFKDSSAEMGVIGSFDNWTVPGEVMTKNAAGLWETTIQAGNADVITYKFYSKGTWIFDERAPDKKDDGYGGFNGLIPVADILAGVLPAVPGAAPLPPPKGAKVAGRPKLTFGTTTYVESATTFNNVEMRPKESLINAKSIWKFKGDLVAGMPGYLEVTAFNGSPKLASDDTGIDQGLEALSAGLLFNPLYYLGGNKRPVLDKFRFGFDTPYLTYETGYAKTPLPLHKTLLWNTVSEDTDSGDGYSAFRLGPKAQNLGDLTIDAGLVPNKSLSGAYGFYGWTRAEAYGITLEAQMDHKASTSNDVSLYFKDPSQQDLVLGFEAIWEGFLARGQLLTSSFLKGSSADLLPAKQKSAYKVELGYQDYYGDTEVIFGYATRGGIGAKLMYLTAEDMDKELGVAATQTLSLNGFQKFGYWGTAKWETSAVLETYQPASNNIAVTLRPGFILDFAKLSLAPVSVEAYGKVVMNTRLHDSDRLAWLSAGSKVSIADPVPNAVKSLDLYYKAENAANELFNSLLAEAKFTQNLALQGGAGFRAGPAAATVAAVVLGASYVLDAPQAQSPSVYAQLVANMDPYKGPGSTSFDLTDFGPTDGATAYDGLTTVRMGIRWDY